MIFTEFNIQKVEQRIESNLEILKNSASESYEILLEKCGGDPKQFVERAIKNIQDNPEIITILYENLDGFYKSLDETEERIKNLEANANKLEDLVMKLFNMKDREVSCPEVQNIMAEIDVLNVKLIGVDFQKAEEVHKFNEANLANSPNELKKYKEALEHIDKKIDELYGLSFYDFYKKALEYYLINK